MKNAFLAMILTKPKSYVLRGFKAVSMFIMDIIYKTSPNKW